MTVLESTATAKPNGNGSERGPKGSAGSVKRSDPALNAAAIFGAARTADTPRNTITSMKAFWAGS